ncbi:MAG TPA: adenosine deaminase [Terriglobales bacterium]
MRASARTLALLLGASFATQIASAQVQPFRQTPARPATAARQMVREPQAPPPENYETHAAHALEAARANEGSLYAFLREMPKGADLHNHDVGAVYAESWVKWAAQSNLCVDSKTMTLSKAPCTTGQVEAKSALTDPVLYRQMLDEFSMRGARHGGPGTFAGHDHFFDTFFKFFAAADGHMGQVYAEALEHAADSHVQYLELMSTPDNGAAIGLGSQLTWNNAVPPEQNFAAMRKTLMNGGMNQAVAEARKNLDAWEAQRDSALGCNQADPLLRRAACDVKSRYIYVALRAFTPEQVFAQLLMGFELSQKDKRVVGVNMAQAEDWLVPMRDFRLHMRMLDYLKQQYPDVHITLHAGELAPGIVPPEGMRFHIRESILRGHAERIGHGVDVLYEDDPNGLLSLMAKRDVLVEVCLTSNDGILGVRGKQHPLNAYLKAGVHVALATDDEGVSRSDMTREYMHAVHDQQLEYPTLKRMARNSVEHSFLPGQSLWSDPHRFTPVHECSLTGTPSPACQKLLAASEKAREEWKLEKAFVDFETKFKEDPKHSE